MKRFITITLILAFYFVGISFAQKNRIILGDEQTELYIPLLKNKRVALFSNHTGVVNNKHILDLLIEKGVKPVAVFSPEHGFRGEASAGENVKNDVDSKTGVKILSLYGGKTKLDAQTMNKFDIVIADIQDVGLRFYTYYITLCRIMDAAALHNKEVIILDRPNPNGHIVDGPILNMKYRSGIGKLPIPILHGMTIGELAFMANEKLWLKNKKKCKLKVIKCKNYSRDMEYVLTIPPSPNLPNQLSVYLYASLCPIEGTVVSLGRGTDKPFQIYGHHSMKGCSYKFTPKACRAALKPKEENKLCYGVDLSNMPLKEARNIGFSLDYVIDAYNKLDIGDKFFRPFFNLIVGVDYIIPMIKEGKNSKEIAKMWQKDVARFKKERKPYLLYK